MLAQIGWLPWGLVDDWRRGRVDYLERVAAVQPDRLATALEHLRRWAAREGPEPSEVAYVAATRDRRPLRFTADGDQAAERVWRTHWTRPDLSTAARERLTHRADLDHLVFLPAGNAALSRRAKQASRLSAVVVRFSRSRKRYERQGILVEEAALGSAEAQCLADEDARSRRRERDRQRRADQDLRNP